jgi:hypothetical protein
MASWAQGRRGLEENGGVADPGTTSFARDGAGSTASRAWGQCLCGQRRHQLGVGEDGNAYGGLNRGWKRRCDGLGEDSMTTWAPGRSTMAWAPRKFWRKFLVDCQHE